MRLRTYLQIGAMFPIIMAILVCADLHAESRLSMVARQDAVISTASFIGALGLIMSGIMLALNGGVLRRLAEIRHKMASAAGEESAGRPGTGGDETSGIIDAFNRLSRRLDEAREALKTEASKHQNVADALNKSNIMLSDTLVKLKRAQRQVVESERLSALGQMASGISHNFNNALTPIVGLSDFFLTFPDSLNNHESVLQHMKTISEAARRASDQVKRLADFFHPTREADTKPVNLNEIAEQAILLTRPRWKEQAEACGINIRMETDFAAVPLIEGNAGDLHETIANLIFNAVEALSKDGMITVSTRATDKSVTFKIKDTGEGMNEEIRRRCFEPFFSLKGEGFAGMGLTVASGIVRRHDGTISIESSTGQGTTVTVELPIRKRIVESQVLPQGAEKELPALTILLADDELWVRQTIVHLLELAGHKVEAAADGSEALAKFKVGRFDLAIVDRAMPGMSGDDLAFAIKRESSGTPVILLTGFGDIMREQGVYPEGVDQVLSKPTTMTQLKKAIAQVLSGVQDTETAV